jgi:quinol monooxygenase YgiN
LTLELVERTLCLKMSEGRNAMFSRVVAVRTKPGKTRELTKTIQDKIVPILKSQPGFVDEILLVSDTEPDQILALSFWESQEDADRYTHEQFPRVNELISHLVQSAPVSRTFNVNAFISHKISAGQAA